MFNPKKQNQVGIERFLEQGSVITKNVVQLS